MARKGAIPEAGERSPETGLLPRVGTLKRQKPGRNSNKNKGFLAQGWGAGLARRVHCLTIVDAFR